MRLKQIDLVFLLETLRDADWTSCDRFHNSYSHLLATRMLVCAVSEPSTVLHPLVLPLLCIIFIPFFPYSEYINIYFQYVLSSFSLPTSFSFTFSDMLLLLSSSKDKCP
jgi:hypothetical protein